MKKIIYLLPLLFFACIIMRGAEILLDGGKAIPKQLQLIESSTDHLNFCFAKRFQDGIIFLNHSAGVHTITEKQCFHVSLDNGKNWQKTNLPFLGFNAFETTQGEKKGVYPSDTEVKELHLLKIRTFDWNNQKIDIKQVPVAFPFESNCMLHREVLKTSDNRLLVTGYGRKKGAAKLYNFVLESADQGESWKFLSVIAEDIEGKTSEGPNETALIELANGDILAYYRIASQGALYQSRSKDGGKIWSPAKEVAPFGVAPAAVVLKNGTLVVVTGRPKLYLLIDFSGTGEAYQQLEIYGGHGSSYASILETAPNELLIIYDKSDFSTWKNQELLNSIMGLTLDIIKDATIKINSQSDHRRAQYECYYSPADRKLPYESSFASAYNYQKKEDPNCESYFEIIDIPERPQPLLRLVNQGTGEKTKGSQFSHHVNVNIPEDAKEITMGTEFRLQDAVTDKPQFAILFSLPGQPAPLNGYITFARDAISYRNKGVMRTAAYPLGLDFHEFEIKGSILTKQYSLFQKGQPQPLFTADLTADQSLSPRIFFGDGSSNIFGIVELSYLGWSFGR